SQCRLSACSAQKPSGSSLDRCQSRSYSARLLTWACAANSAGGGNRRVSLRTLVILAAAGLDMLGFPHAVRRHGYGRTAPILERAAPKEKAPVAHAPALSGTCGCLG